jgi:hypothetical protein
MQRDGQHIGRSCGNTQRFVCAKPLVAEPALCTDHSPTPNQLNAIEGKVSVTLRVLVVKLALSMLTCAPVECTRPRHQGNDPYNHQERPSSS